MIYFNDEVKEYNIGHLFDKKDDFKVLSNTTGLFEQVKIDTVGMVSAGVMTLIYPVKSYTLIVNLFHYFKLTNFYYSSQIIILIHIVCFVFFDYFVFCVFWIFIHDSYGLIKLRV